MHEQLREICSCPKICIVATFCDRVLSDPLSKLTLRLNVLCIKNTLSTKSTYKPLVDILYALNHLENITICCILTPHKTLTKELYRRVIILQKIESASIAHIENKDNFVTDQANKNAAEARRKDTCHSL